MKRLPSRATLPPTLPLSCLSYGESSRQGPCSPTSPGSASAARREILFTPADEADLAYFLAHSRRTSPVTIIGSAPICWCATAACRRGDPAWARLRRDRGRGRSRIRAGAAVPDMKARARGADAGIAGLAFYRGIPGTVGGALRMNGGAHGRETCEVVVEARAVDRGGRVHVLTRGRAALRLSPLRRAGRPDLHRGAVPGRARRSGRDPRRDGGHRRPIARPTQPIKSRTGGSTFKNPPGNKRLAAHRRRRAAGASRRRRACVGDALQFPHQRGRAPAPRTSRSLARRCARA